MNALLWTVLGLFALKIIWNLTVPYRLLGRLKKYEKGQEREGISLSPGIEIFLLLLAIFLSWLSNGNEFINRPFRVLALAGGALLASYVHFFVVGMIGGWLVANFFKKRGGQSR